MYQSLTKKPKLFIITLAYLSLFALGLIDNFRGALLPEILQYFKVNNTQGAYFFISTSIFSVLASFSSRHWLEKIPALALWRWGVLAMSLGALGIFFAPHFLILLMTCTILGLGFGTLGVTQNLLISLLASPKSKQKLLSGLHSMYGLASFFSPLLVGVLTQRGFSWNSVFMIACVVTLFVFFFSFLIPTSDLNACVDTATLPLKNSQTQASSRLDLSSWLFGLSLAFYVSLELLVSTRLTTYLKTVHQWSLVDSSHYLSYFFLALLSGRALFTFFHPPLATRKLLFISLLSSSLLILMGLRIHPFFLTLSGLFLAPFYPLAITLVSELFPEKVSSVMSLTISLQSFLFILVNLVIGHWTDHFGIASAMNFAFVFGGASWITLMKLKRVPSISYQSL